MNRIKQIEQRRAEIIGQLGQIRSMELGTLNEQMLPVRHKGSPEPVMRGPYYVLARWVDGKTRSRRVAKDELEQVRHDVDNRKQFDALCAEFKELTHELGVLEREQQGITEEVKKKPRRRSNKASK